MAQSTGDDELRILIQRVARRIRNERASDDLGDTQLSVLVWLDKHGELSPGELAEHDRVTPPSMNRTLNGLESEGLVSRHPAADDARRVRVSLTDAGRTILAETRALRTAWFSRRLEELTPDERHRLEAVIPILRKMADS